MFIRYHNTVSKAMNIRFQKRGNNRLLPQQNLDLPSTPHHYG